VVDSRATGDGEVRRRRVCNHCKRRFTTYERVGSPNLKVIKRDERTEPFSTDKLLRSLRRVCRHRPAVTPAVIERIAYAIEAQLYDAGARSVRSCQIVDLALARLADVDRVSYHRLAANYLDEDGQLRTEPRPPPIDEPAQQDLFAGD
jgi:transcriptional repressor NrdR